MRKAERTRQRQAREDKTERTRQEGQAGMTRGKWLDRKGTKGRKDKRQKDKTGRVK